MIAKEEINKMEEDYDEIYFRIVENLEKILTDVAQLESYYSKAVNQLEFYGRANDKEHH